MNSHPAITAKQIAARITELKNQIAKLKDSLEKSVKLQGHYAKLLNMFDGGERIIFKDAEEWMNRCQGRFKYGEILADHNAKNANK